MIAEINLSQAVDNLQQRIAALEDQGDVELPAEIQRELKNIIDTFSTLMAGSKGGQVTELSAREYLDIAEVILLSLDLDGNIAILNRKGHQVLGYQDGELIGKNWFETCLPEQNQRQVSAVFDQIVRDEMAQTEYVENWVVTLGGEERLIAWHNTIVKDEYGQVIGTLSSGEDITTRKQIEDALAESEKKFRTLFRILPIGISILDSEQKIVDVNPALEQILGLTKEELLSGQYSRRKYIYPDGSMVPPGEFPSARVFRGEKEVKNVEIGVVKENDETIWVNIGAAPFPVAGLGVAITTADINLRKRAELDLLRERDLLNNLMETSPSAITVVNCQGEIIFANRRAEEIFGLSRSEITALVYDAPEWRITDFEGNPIPEDVLPFVQVTTTGQPVFDVRHAIQWKDGRRVLLSINAAPLLNAEGEIDGMISTIDDITAQVYAEQRRIEQLAKELKSLEILAPLPQTAVTAQMYGSQSLRLRQPKTFADLVETYQALLGLALERRVYRTHNNLSFNLRALADKLGNLHAGPRDLVDIHTHALENINAVAGKTAKMEALATEGRFVALEAMGYLASYYRDRLSAARSLIVSETSKPGDLASGEGEK